MKVKTLLKKAKDEIKDEKSLVVINKIKDSLKDIASCEKTLEKLNKTHKKLLNADLEDLELNNFEY